MSCTSCLSNDDIQMPDQVSVPCTTPYFHKDTLTPPSSSRSPSLEGGGHGPSTYVARDASLYNARPLLRNLHPALEGIQLMSITGYEMFVVCFFVVCSPSYGFRKIIPRKKLLHKLQKSTVTMGKNFFNEQKVGMLQKRAKV